MLQIIKLSGLINWSVQYLLQNTFSFNEDYELIKIGDFLTRNKTGIEIQDTEVYKRVTIKIRNGGVFLRDSQKGKNIGTKKQFIIKKGQFLLSKIDARNGAFGVVPKEVDDAIITGNFWTFDVSYDKINPHFLALIVTTTEFIKFCENASNGTTNRHYLQEELFLEQKIPLPPKEEQDRIVDTYNQKIKLAKEQEEKAKQLEKDIETYLFDALGIEKLEEKESKKGLQFVSLTYLDRWDVWTNKSEVQSTKYKNTKFGFVVQEKPQYGANVKGEKKISDTRYIRITDINEAGFLNKEFVSPKEVEEKYLLRENDFLIARSGNTVGKTLLYKKEYGRAIYAGYLVRYNINFSLIDPDYLFLFTKSYPFKKWIETNQRVSGQPNINGQEFLQAPLILPPIETQTQIANDISQLKAEIKKLKEQAVENRKQAITDFEKEIFS